jgi:DNA polymerase family A
LDEYASSTDDINKLIPKVSALGLTIPSAVHQSIKLHTAHLHQREPIRINIDKLDSKIQRYSKRKSNKSKALTSQLVAFRRDLIIVKSGVFHRPKIKPFHTLTGRDTAVGSAIHYLSKDHWAGILLPPEGYSYVLFDYEQQEMIIAATKASHIKLLEMYEKSDIYAELNRQITGDELTRKQFKAVILSYLNGGKEQGIVEKLNVSRNQVQTWLLKLDRMLGSIRSVQSKNTSRAMRDGFIKSLDWRLVITNETKYSTISNWPLQATGADIMRRACTNLEKANIPVLLTNHDSFLIKLKTENLETQRHLAIDALVDASAEVLNGFKLKVKVEITLPSIVRNN